MIETVCVAGRALYPRGAEPRAWDLRLGHEQRPAHSDDGCVCGGGRHAGPEDGGGRGGEVPPAGLDPAGVLLLEVSAGPYAGGERQAALHPTQMEALRVQTKPRQADSALWSKGPMLSARIKDNSHACRSFVGGLISAHIMSQYAYQRIARK
eukprot:scaffold110397_cov30-Prasinocladus_malaysianus.AAC.1